MMLNGKENLPSSRKSAVKIILLEPTSLEKFNWLIHLQHVRGEIGTCKYLIKNEIVRSHGKNDYVFFKQGIIAKEEGHVQEALEIFQKCLKLNNSSNNNSVLLNEIGKCLFEMQRYRLALNAFLETVKLNKILDWQLFYFIAETYLKLGNFEKAKCYAEQSVKIAKQEECFLLLLKIQLFEHDFKAAISTANAGVESCPESVKLVTKSGLMYLRINELQNAFERFSQALALDQTNPKCLLGIGCITHQHEEYDVALSKYKIAVLYDSESVALWSNIGMCFYSKQKYVAAISCLKRALWLAPLNWKILYNLSLVHVATGQSASAFNFACAAVNLRSSYTDNLLLLGCTLFELKDYINALKAFKEALNVNVNKPDIFAVANVALMLEIMGLRADSQEFIKKYKEICDDGPNDEVLNLIRTLEDVQQNSQNDEGIV